MTDVSCLSTAEARNRCADFIHRVANQKEWIVLTRRGKPVAGAVPLEDFRYIEGPEDDDVFLQGIQTYEDIMLVEFKGEERVSEASVACQVDNGVHRVTSAELRENLADVINRVKYGRQRIIVTRRAWDLFALIPPDVFERYLLFEELEEEHDRKMIDEMERNGELEDTVPLEDLLERYDIT